MLPGPERIRPGEFDPPGRFSGMPDTGPKPKSPRPAAKFHPAILPANPSIAAHPNEDRPTVQSQAGGGSKRSARNSDTAQRTSRIWPINGFAPLPLEEPHGIFRSPRFFRDARGIFPRPPAGNARSRKAGCLFPPLPATFGAKVRTGFAARPRGKTGYSSASAIPSASRTNRSVAAAGVFQRTYTARSPSQVNSASSKRSWPYRTVSSGGG